MLTTLAMFAQDSLSGGSTTTTVDPAQASAATMVFLLISLPFIILTLAANWRVNTKARQPGWACLVPIYGTIVMLRMIGRPWWWLLLLLIPFVNIVISIIMLNDLSRSFGKGAGFTILLLLLPIIGYPMLAWGSATYHGPAAAGENQVPPQSPQPQPPVLQPPASPTPPQPPAQQQPPTLIR